MSKPYRYFSFIAGSFLFCVSLYLLACQKTSPLVTTVSKTQETDARFSLLDASQTGVDFANVFEEDYTYNILFYLYMYNGGGVAAGDVNGDGLPDLYFSACFGSNKLYINLGDFRFKDVTEIAGVAASVGLKTGVTMADINGDGRLDIYSCRTSKEDDGQKNNHVFINMGNRNVDGIDVPIFEDQAKPLGLLDNANSNYACFFDYDRDGDLDLFLLNHRVDFGNAISMRLQHAADGSVRRVSSPETPFESNRLYRNDNGRFVDVTAKAGLTSATFGLSATPADINQDGWMDLFVANDYIEQDNIFINNRDGTFTDHAVTYLKHSSYNSMGSDVADFNNDGLVDIVTLDMKPEDPIRYKSMAHAMHYDRYNILVQYGYGRQVGRNVLQVNNGNGTFSEIGQFAGIAETDWSWASLFADFNNDGWKDLYVTNGYRKDVNQLDYFNYFSDSISQTGGISMERYPDIEEFINYLPEEKLANYLFINDTRLSFIQATKAAGMDHPSFSNGAAYADLDLDGDLDLIVNNIDAPAFIYRNDITGRSWLQIAVEQQGGNTKGIGAEAKVFSKGMTQLSMLMPFRGFLSSSEPILHFGLGDVNRIDSIILMFPEGQTEIMRDVQPNQRLIWRKGTGAPYAKPSVPTPTPLFVGGTSIPGWIHQENDFVDFKRERFLPFMLSAEGPCMATGDINGDGLEDFYVGNGHGFPAALFVQSSDGGFIRVDVPAFAQDIVYEDCGATLADMDGDGDLDLIVVSGGNASQLNAPEYMTRYYSNDGKGGFTRVTDFPLIRTNAGAVLVLDYDQDQAPDIFIAGRCTPGGYPAAPASHLLRNDNGRFVDVTKEVFPDFDRLGMIADIQAGDLDGDGIPEIVIAGEWMPVSVFTWKGKKFENVTTSYGLDKTSGWWKCISLADIDGDGDLDIIAGNIGLNHRMKATQQEPITLITNDFDGNGSLDPIMCFYHQKQLYPFAGRDAIISQVPRLKKKFTRYTPYANATIRDIFSKEELAGSTYHYAHTFSTTLFINEKGKFTRKELPHEVQLSPVYDMIVRDFDHDGRMDILMAGNFLYAETETGEMDAGNGTLLLQQSDGSFRYVPNRDHGFWAQGEVRVLRTITLADGTTAILTGNNRGPVEMHRMF